MKIPDILEQHSFQRLSYTQDSPGSEEFHDANLHEAISDQRRPLLPSPPPEHVRDKLESVDRGHGGFHEYDSHWNHVDKIWFS